jgi:CBS domain-containing protein
LWWVNGSARQDAPLDVAAGLIHGHQIRLPVVDRSGKLAGIVTRRDLLNVFLRPGEEIAAEVYGLPAGTLLEDADGEMVKVRDGVAVL